VGSCSPGDSGHVIVRDERHLLRLMRDYVSYYHQDRVHDSLEKDTPDKRAIEQRPAANATVKRCLASVVCIVVTRGA